MSSDVERITGADVLVLVPEQAYELPDGNYALASADDGMPGGHRAASLKPAAAASASRSRALPGKQQTQRREY